MLSTRYLVPQLTALKWRVSDWHYAVSGKRDLRLDFLRGFAVFAMIVDHLGSTSWFHSITGGNHFFVSAAEAFVFISGLLVGIIYGDILRKSGWWQATRKALARAWKLYLLTVPLTLVFITLVYKFNLPFASWYVLGDPLNLVFDVVTMRRTFAFADIPLLYTQLLLVSPVAFWLLSKRKTGWLLSLSVALWGAYQFAPDMLAGVPWNIEGMWIFKAAPWQLLFIAAMVIGYHRKTVARRLARFVRFRYFVLLALAVAGLIAFYQNVDLDAPLIAALFDKASLGIGRLLASSLVFATFYVASTLFWGPLNSFAGWLLNPLGENSLYSYTIHVLLLVGYYALWQVAGVGDGGSGDIVANSLLQLAAVLMVWQLIRHRVLFRIIPR